MTSLVATTGDPASIGPEVSLSAISQFFNETLDAKVILFGSQQSLKQADSQLLKELIHSQRLELIDTEPNTTFSVGKGDHNSGKRALSDLRKAVEFCLERKLHGLVTGPVDKHLCAQAEKSFRGQTEYLQGLSGSASVAMLMQSPQLRVGLVTTHIPLRQVSDHITIDRIKTVSRLMHSYLKVFSDDPKIAVCGLNPHASDRGLIGTEERDVIEPSIRQLRDEGLSCSGPYPADSLFFQSDRFDAVLAMYHDQALIPIKTHGFFEAINISLGLPFLRTSVDHGTAFNLAGQGQASSSSYQNALRAAFEWSSRKSQRHS